MMSSGLCLREEFAVSSKSPASFWFSICRNILFSCLQASPVISCSRAQGSHPPWPFAVRSRSFLSSCWSLSRTDQILPLAFCLGSSALSVSRWPLWQSLLPGNLLWGKTKAFLLQFHLCASLGKIWHLCCLRSPHSVIRFQSLDCNGRGSILLPV